MPVPVNTVPPVISGNHIAGSTLSSTTGTWTNTPTSYSYQWQIIGTPTTNISGATSSTYTTTTAEVGSAIDCQVTATNGSGDSSPRTSSDSIIVTASLSVSANIAEYLQSVTALGLNFNGAGTVNCFVGLLNDTPDQLVAIFERPGMAPLPVLAGNNSSVNTGLLDQPIIQIRVRSASGSYEAGNTLMQGVYKALEGVTEQLVPASTGLFFHLMLAQGFPAYLGLDVRQRHEWSQNYRVILENSQRA